MSLWEFKACCDGWNTANNVNANKPTAPSDEEFWDAVHGEGAWRDRRPVDGKDKEP